MDFNFTEEQEAIRESVARICAKYDDNYWLERDRDGAFPDEFVRDMAAGGWLGIATPPEYGGAGLGVADAAVMMMTVAQSGGAKAAASAIHMNIFGPNPIVVFGTDAQKRRMLMPLIEGRERCCFGVTEPDAGLDTTHLKTRAVKDGDRYVVHGRKVWTSTAQVADKILLITRTTPIEDCAKPSQGMTLFYTDLDRRRVEVREIEKMGRKSVDSNELFIDGLVIPEEDRIGEEGEGFKYLLHGLNPERILIAAEALGIGKAAIERAARYARERVVFGRPIGQNQAIQHPLAESWMALQSAELMTFKAATLYDAGLPCGLEANSAKFLAGKAGWEACLTAVKTHGGYGYAKEFHVERFLREVLIDRLAPVSEELILCHIAERALGLPKSY